jgi:hypothetical protein
MDIISDTILRPGNVEEGAVPNPENIYNSSKEEFTKMMQDGLEASLAEFKANVDIKEQSYRQNLQRLNNIKWELNDEKRKLKDLRELNENHMNAYDKQFDALLNHKKIEAVAIDSGALLIKTVDLDMTHPLEGYSVHLGQFEIMLPLKASDVHMLRIENKTNAREADDGVIFHHPNIAGDDPCFGSLDTELFDVLSRGDIVGGIDLLFMYLETINPDDEYGKNWEYWVE